MTILQGTDFRTVEAACTSAQEAAAWLQATSPSERAALLRTLAEAVDDARDHLVPIAHEETFLPTSRLVGELARTSGQLRLFADVVLDGSCFDVVIDRARGDLAPPRPDLRRALIALGPVAVFTASNFPFAFSTLGGDTASALAAGCPVVVKAHPGHPRLTLATMQVARAALSTTNAPSGVLELVGPGLEAGVQLVQDPRVRAVAFTGSTRAGLALQRLANERPNPVPFYGELGSINPVFVTRAAIGTRTAEIADGFVGSFTLGAGQFCTKPGLMLAPRSAGLRKALVAATAASAGQRMLNDAIHEAYRSGLETRLRFDDVEVLYAGVSDSTHVTPSLLAIPVDGLARQAELLDECFGPMSLLVEYDHEEQMVEVAQHIEGVLTATVIAEGNEPIVRPLLPVLVERAGRVLWNDWPTGVAVTWSMHHGGPFPATTSSLHTSVGATAVRRFQRPVSWQGWPDHLLPPSVQSDNPWGLPRRVDGTLTLPTKD